MAESKTDVYLRCALGLFVIPLAAVPGVDLPPVLFLGAFVVLGVDTALPGPDLLLTCFVCAIVSYDSDSEVCRRCDNAQREFRRF